MRLLVAIVCSALLASCARSTNSSLLPPAAVSEAGAGDNVYGLLYSFKSGEDAGFPYASLTPLNGSLYGTTYGGGGGYEWGTVFRISTTGEEHVLYRFKAGNDGAHPYAGLIPVGGKFYGTTQQGGTSGDGTVFSISTAGVEHVLYSFKSGTDGQYPYGRLLDVNGTLYGTTSSGGGGDGWGVVFKVTTSGEEHVVYRFKAGNDGAHPYDGLIAVKGMLYGTTYQGGTSGAGTVFRVSPSGDERVIYSFKGGSDGEYPYARLLLYKGALYGTTYTGGVSYGWGVVFKVSTSGAEKVLYRFKANADGAHPYYAGLIEQNGKLYGTTYQGGAGGAGTVFSESPSGGDDHVVYSFKSGTDGEYPYAGLMALNGAVYGTTYQGGANSAGTVFKLSL
jgi:uncharacterized repeat protein (TIGR03803 family)